MALFCKAQLTPLQRRTVLLLSATLLLTVVGTFLVPGKPNPLLEAYPSLWRAAAVVHASAGLTVAVALLSVIPVLWAVAIVGRYLKSEPDEFIRMLVIRAVLWGVAVTMAGDAIVGVLMVTYKAPFPMAMLNADLMFAATGISFRILRWSYR